MRRTVDGRKSDTRSNLQILRLYIVTFNDASPFYNFTNSTMLFNAVLMILFCILIDLTDYSRLADGLVFMFASFSSMSAHEGYFTTFAE
jgi:hypothetical protein